MRPIVLLIAFLAFSACGLQAQTSELLPAKKDGQWGFIDTKGEWKIAPQYTRCLEFEDRPYTWVEKNSKSYLINRAGDQISELPFSDIIGIYDDVIVYQEGSLLGWYVKGSNLYVIPTYKEVVYWRDSQHFLVRDSSGYGIMDLGGKEIMPPDFDQIKRVNNLYQALKSGETSLYSYSGNVIVPPAVQNLVVLDDYVISLKAHKFCTVFDMSGHLVHEEHYDKLEHLTRTYFGAKRKGETRLFDVEDNTTYDSLSSLYELMLSCMELQPCSYLE